MQYPLPTRALTLDCPVSYSASRPTHSLLLSLSSRPSPALDSLLDFGEDRHLLFFHSPLLLCRNSIHPSSRRNFSVFASPVFDEADTGLSSDGKAARTCCQIHVPLRQYLRRTEITPSPRQKSRSKRSKAREEVKGLYAMFPGPLTQISHLRGYQYRSLPVP